MFKYKKKYIIVRKNKKNLFLCVYFLKKNFLKNLIINNNKIKITLNFKNVQKNNYTAF